MSSCLLHTEAHSQLLEASTFFGSWFLSFIFKTRNIRLSLSDLCSFFCFISLMQPGKFFFSLFNGSWNYIWPMQLIQDNALILRSIPLITAAKFLCYIRKNIPRSAHFHMFTSPGWETKTCAFWGERYYSATTFMNTKHN